MYPNPFSPIWSTTAAGQQVASPAQVSASTTATAVVLPLPADGVHNDVRVENPTSAWAYITFGDDSISTVTYVAGASNGIGFAPNSVEVINLPPTAKNASVILSSGTGYVRFMRGIGL